MNGHAIPWPLRHGRPRWSPFAVAGVTYAAAWIAGLAVWPSKPDVATSDGEVVAQYAGASLAHRAGVLPRRLGYVGAVLAPALVASGFGYLLLSSSPAQAVFVSGPLLVVWATGVGLFLGRGNRAAP